MTDSKYMTKSYLVTMINLQKGSGSVSESDIPDDVMLETDAQADASLFEEDVDPENVLNAINDSNDNRSSKLAYLMRGAALHWALEILMTIKFKGLYWSPVVLSRQDMGRISMEFQRNMPLFFFAQGEARKFYQLLQVETPRMKAYRLCRLVADVMSRWNSSGEFSWIDWNSYQPDPEPSKKTSVGNWRTGW